MTPSPEVIALRVQRADAEIAALWKQYDAHVQSAVNDPIQRERLRGEIRHAYLVRYITGA